MRTRSMAEVLLRMQQNLDALQADLEIVEEDLHRQGKADAAIDFGDAVAKMVEGRSEAIKALGLLRELPLRS